MPQFVWQDESDRRFTSLVVSGDTLLATGHPDDAPDDTFLSTINIKDGADGWRHDLAANAVKGGTAIDRNGRIYVALENGQLWCFAPAEN